MCPNPKCNGYCAQCPKVSITSDSRNVATNGRTYFDLDALERRREAERKVIEAAKEWAHCRRNTATTATILVGTAQRLELAVRALRALDASEGGA